MNRKIEIWGSYPPPIGGVTIHIYRLIHRLHEYDQSIILKNFGYNTSNIPYIRHARFSGFEFIKLLFIKKRLIHLQSNNFLAFLLLLLFGKKHRLGITLHNKNLIKVQSRFKYEIIQSFLQEAKFIILNDPNYKQQLINTFHLKENRIHVLPAFIPPLPCEYKGIDQSILDFKQKFSFVISANAYKLRIENNIDIYGFDLLIHLIKFLIDKDINVGLIFCLPLIGDQDYYNKCLLLIDKLKIAQHILIYQKQITNGFEIWQNSDLFIRPTSTDIEGISVKEALFCGTPAIASDVCVRPKEAILFRNRDFKDLSNKVLGYYEKRNILKQDTIIFKENSVNQILDIYRSII